MHPPDEKLAMPPALALTAVEDASPRDASSLDTAPPQVIAIEAAPTDDAATQVAASSSSPHYGSYVDVSSQETSRVEASSPDTSYEDAVPLQGAATEIDSTDVAPIEVASTDIAPFEIATSQDATTEVATSQDAAQVASTGIASTEIASIRVGTSQDASVQETATQVAGTEVTLTQVAGTQVVSTEAASTEVASTEVALTTVALAQAASLRAASPRVVSPYSYGYASYISQYGSPYGFQYGSPYGYQHGFQYGFPYGMDAASYNPYGLPYGPPYNLNAAMDTSQNPSPPIRQQSKSEAVASIEAYMQYRNNNSSKYPVRAPLAQPSVQPPAQQPTIDQIVAPIEKLSVRPRQESPVVIPLAFEEFRKFSEFPAELRLKIWHRALPLFGNLIRIGGCSREGLAHYPVFHSNVRHATSGFVPVRKFGDHTLLAINKESRNELLKYYPAPFNSSTLNYRYGETSESIHLSVADLRVNLEHDTFFFYDSNSIKPHSKPFPFQELFTCLFRADKEERIRRSIRRIALAEEVLTDMFRVEDATSTSNVATQGPSTHTPQHAPYKLLEEFGELEQITIVAKNLEHNYLFNGFKEIEDGTCGKFVENLKKKLDARVDAREDLKECDTKVVQIKQKYFSSKLTRENMAEQIAASMARRCLLPADQPPPYVPKRHGGKVDYSPGWK